MRFSRYCGVSRIVTMSLIRPVMKSLIGCWVFFSSCGWCEQSPPLTDSQPVAVIVTNSGNIAVALDTQAAPKTTANFIAYANDYFYDGLIFHRIIDGFAIQSGGYWFDLRQKAPDREAIANESNNGLKNWRGTIAMARDSDPDSAQAQFYINLTDNTHLDATDNRPGYTVFGKVIAGMDVADKIGKTPIRAANDSLTHVPQEIVQIQRISIQGASQKQSLPSHLLQSQGTTP